MKNGKIIIKRPLNIILKCISRVRPVLQNVRYNYLAKYNSKKAQLISLRTLGTRQNAASVYLVSLYRFRSILTKPVRIQARSIYSLKLRRTQKLLIQSSNKMQVHHFKYVLTPYRHLRKIGSVVSEEKRGQEFDPYIYI